jgi:hypothetical protein
VVEYDVVPKSGEKTAMSVSDKEDTLSSFMKLSLFDGISNPMLESRFIICRVGRS